MLLVIVARPRQLFRVLQPLLFESPRPVARTTLSFLLGSAVVSSFEHGVGHRTRRTKAHDVATALFPTPDLVQWFLSWQGDSLHHLAERRRLTCTLQVASGARRLLGGANRVVAWVQPSTVTAHERAWEERLLHWENQLLRAQTVAGFLSTLGGAYFMCHRLSSAVILAQCQQRVARVLHDSSMFHKCLVNQAYNLVHAGQFRGALRLLGAVKASVRRERPPDKTVLLQMCNAARLFAKRVRRASRLLDRAPAATTATEIDAVASPSPPQRSSGGLSAGLSAVVDDYARIRVVRDESTPRDLTAPFSRS